MSEKRKNEKTSSDEFRRINSFFSSCFQVVDYTSDLASSTKLHELRRVKTS
jgi:hypothetical protein